MQLAFGRSADSYMGKNGTIPLLTINPDTNSSFLIQVHIKPTGTNECMYNVVDTNISTAYEVKI
jgi:hypothetical protein